MKFNMRGMKDLERQLKKIEKDAKKEIDGKVSLENLFSDSFLRKHTDFRNFDDFIDSLPIKIESQDDFDNIETSTVDPIIKEKTQFNNWDEFGQAAANLYAKNKLDKLF